MVLGNVIRIENKWFSFMKRVHIKKYLCSYLQVGSKDNNKGSTVNAISSLQKPDDLSFVTPNFPKSFNLAAYVNSSETLIKLINLNVNLSKIEKKPYHVVEKLLKLDFEKDMKEHMVFLSNYVNMEYMGDFITKNPMIFYEQLEDLKIRVNYLESKRFSIEQISRIISRNPFWLMFSTERIDRRFGFYQQRFDLHGNEVRSLATKQPKLITYNLNHINCSMFVIKEELGFNDKELKALILNKPKIYMMNQKALLERFNYIHNIMKIRHDTIMEYPEILLSRNFRIKQRHLFLQSLNRAQYDPKKENYISIKSLVENTDIEFCKHYAKSSIDEFNMFLKTL